MDWSDHFETHKLDMFLDSDEDKIMHNKQINFQSFINVLFNDQSLSLCEYIQSNPIITEESITLLDNDRFVLMLNQIYETNFTDHNKQNLNN
jgi:hypothetical protein